MKILIGHNHYQWAGGEDAVVRTESKLLTDAGHQVKLFEANNSFGSGLQRVWAARNFIWSRSSYRRMREALRAFKPDAAHFHNIYFSLTPSVYDACRDEGVPVVQSLHNFRMYCANALFFREGRVCEDCVHKSPLQGIIHSCYKHSVLATGAATAVTQYHHWQKTWTHKVDQYITATEFTKAKYAQAGLPADKITVKPNVFCPSGDPVKPRGEYVLYVGRLSPEKGVRLLLEAWEKLPHIPLKLMGCGPLEVDLKSRVEARGMGHVEFLGHVDARQYDHYMQGAKFLVIPSQCYENFPRIAVEAFAFGLPVLASRLGSLQEIIIDGETGFCFDHLRVEDLAQQARRMWAMDLGGMSARTRAVFDEHYNPAKNLRQLLSVYEKAAGRPG